MVPSLFAATSGTGMEILGIGSDIVECPRIGKMIEQHGELFLRRVYTDREIRYCQSRKHAIEHFAGRSAAKEAILKALGTGGGRGVSWTDIEVRNGIHGQPRVLVCGEVSHQPLVAAAGGAAVDHEQAAVRTVSLYHLPFVTVAIHVAAERVLAAMGGGGGLDPKSQPSDPH